MGGSNFVTLGPLIDSDDGRLSGVGVTLLSLTPSSPGTIIAASGGKRIGVFGMVYAVGGAGNYQFLDLTASGATIAALTGPLLGNSTTDVLPYSQFPWFTCAVSDSFCVQSTNGTINFTGRVLYTQG